MAKDPYCEVYKVVFARAEKHGQETLRHRLAAVAVVDNSRRSGENDFITTGREVTKAG
jgi:hypothetical protein